MIDRAALEETLYNLKKIGKTVLTSLYGVIDYSGSIGRGVGEKYRREYIIGLSEVNAIIGILTAGILGKAEGSLYQVFCNNLLSSCSYHSLAKICSEVGGISLCLPYIVGTVRMIHAWYEFEKKKLSNLIFRG